MKWLYNNYNITSQHYTTIQHIKHILTIISNISIALSSHNNIL